MNNSATDTIDIFFKGSWVSKQISIQEVPSSRKIDKWLEQKSLVEWQRNEQETKRDERKLWDSEIYPLRVLPDFFAGVLASNTRKNTHGMIRSFYEESLYDSWFSRKPKWWLATLAHG